MAKKLSEEEQEAAFHLAVDEGMVESIAFAKNTFSDSSPKYAFAAYRCRVPGARGAEAFAELNFALESAKEAFKTPTPTPEMVFGMFSVHFDDEEDEDEEEGEE